MGGFMNKLVRSVTKKKKLDDAAEEAREMLLAVPRPATQQGPAPRPATQQGPASRPATQQGPAPRKTQQQQMVPYDPVAAWFLAIGDVCQRQQDTADNVSRIRAELEKWQGVYDAHVAGAENIRVFDWRENDKTYKVILVSLKQNLKDALEHAEYLQAEYAALKAQEAVVFAHRRRRAAPAGPRKALPAAEKAESVPWI